MLLHSPADALVVNSACSASQLASGVSAPSEALGIDVDGNHVCQRIRNR
jgi:alkaline phosphatase